MTDTSNTSTHETALHQLIWMLGLWMVCFKQGCLADNFQENWVWKLIVTQPEMLLSQFNALSDDTIIQLLHTILMFTDPANTFVIKDEIFSVFEIFINFIIERETIRNKETMKLMFLFQCRRYKRKNGVNISERHYSRVLEAIDSNRNVVMMLKVIGA